MHNVRRVTARSDLELTCRSRQGAYDRLRSHNVLVDAARKGGISATDAGWRRSSTIDYLAMLGIGSCIQALANVPGTAVLGTCTLSGEVSGCHGALRQKHQQVGWSSQQPQAVASLLLS